MTKPYKCRVEYLESTGIQYIDTGVYGNLNTKIEAKIYASLSSSINYAVVGDFTTSTKAITVPLNGGSDGLYSRFGDRSITTGIQKVTGTYKIAADKEGYYVDGTKIASFNTTTNFTTTNTLMLFGFTGLGRNYFVGKTYYCRIWDGGTLVRDFIPVLDLSGRPAMYDQVSGQLFYNQGSGEFTYGRQIIPVEYLESTGTQWIDTGVKLNNNSSVELDYQLTEASQTRAGLFGNLTSNMSARYGSLLSPTNQYLEYGYGAGNIYWQQGMPDTNRHLIKQEKNKVYFDGSLVNTFNSATFSITDTAPLGNFGYQNYIPAKAKYYSSKWWDGSTLVRDFIPCIDENLVPFMFDTLSGTVYLNAGTGQFKVGPNLEKTWCGKNLHRKLAGVLSNLKKKRKYYCEVEYLESTEQQSNATDALNASWIDTGIVPDNTTQMECRVSFSTLVSENSTEALFGSTAPGTGNFRFAFGYASISPYTNFYVGLGGQNITTSVTRDTNVHTFKIDAINKTWAIDDTSGSFTSSGSLSGTSSIFLFARHNPYYGDNRANKPANAKTYYCKIWQGGRLVRDMIPVLDWNYTPCMYDKITGQLFYTKGTKQFTYGREIHYVEYLESTGTQWFDTGVNINTSTDEVVFNFQLISTTKYQWIMGEHDNGARFGIGVGDGTNLRNVAYGVTTYKVNDTEMYNSMHYFVANSNGAYLNGTQVHGFESFVSTNTIYMFALDFNGSVSSDRAAGRIWKYTQKRNGSLIRDYIPAIDENGVGFMFDRVSHTIFDNAGTGAFKYPARQIDYLESSGTQYINTNITNWNNTTEFETKLSIQQQVGSGNKSWFGCYDSWTGGSVLPAIGTFTNYRVMNNFNTGYTQSSGTDIGIVNGQVGIYKLSQDSLSWSEGSAVAFDRSRVFTNSTSCHLFCTYYNGAAREFASFKMYYFKFWLNGGLVRDYIPVFQDGVAGLLDKANGVFYDNDGTVDFLVGKIVEPEYE